MGLRKPKNIASDLVKRAKWNELTRNNTFTPADIPALSLLCQWYAIAQRCIDDIDGSSQLRVSVWWARRCWDRGRGLPIMGVDTAQ